MARDPKQLRKAYEIKIGKDRADKLSDDQIGLLSKFYNQLSESEQSDIDSGILMGYNNTPLHQMAEEFISEKEDTPEDNSVSVATAIDEDDEDDDDNFEPLGLEELLGDIREEGKKENALAIYEGTREDDLVDEEIDERILKLIGLNEVFDIDYSTYLTLLKEKMVAARMTDSKLSTEESELLTNEFKRVKGKVGRFVIKKKKVNIGNAPENQAIKANKLLPPSSLTPPEAPKDKDTFKKEKKTEKVSKDSQYLLDITKTLKSIKDILTKQSKLNENIKNSERKRLEKERRSGREEDREKKNKGGNFLGNIKKLAPSLGIFDTIVRFITNVLLGKTILGLMDWMSDPANKKKLEAIGNFLKDWWPALTAAFLFFATPLGGFVRLMVKTLGGLTKFLLKNSLKLLKFAGKNPLVAPLLVGGALFAGGALIPKLFPETVDEQERKTKEAPGSNEEKIKALEEQKKNLNPLQIIQGVGSEIDEQIELLKTGKTKKYSGGGLVQAYSKGGLVQGLSDNIVNLSQKTNKVTYASGGGLVGGDTNNITYASGGGLINSKDFNNITYASGGGLINPKIVKNIIHASGGGLISGNNNYFSSSPKITYASGGGLINSRNANNITYASGGGFIGGNSNYFNSSPKITYASGGGLINSRNTNNITYASGGGLINSRNANNITYASGGGLVGGNINNITYASGGGLINSRNANNITYASGGGLINSRNANNITYASGGGLINSRNANNITYASGGGLIGNYFNSSPKITYASGGGLIGNYFNSSPKITYASGGGLINSRNTNNINYASGGGLINSKNINNTNSTSNSTSNTTYASGGGLINSKNINNTNSTSNTTYASGGGLINSKNINNTNSTSNSTSNTTYASGGGFIGGDTNNTTTYASSPKITYASGGGSISRNINAINYFSGGGPSLGTDTVPAMLTPGEFVMSKGAVNKFGANTMMAMNKAGGGTNKPKVISGTSFASGGGFIGGNNNYFNSSPKITYASGGGFIGGNNNYFNSSPKITYASGGGLVGGDTNNITYASGGGLVGGNINNITYASGGGLVDALSFLPGTGTVMAPRASGTGQYADQGTTVQKFLGMPIPGSMKRSKYTSEDIQRYNRLDTGDPSRYLESYDAQDSRSESINKIYSKYGRTPTSPAVRSKKREVSDTPTPGTSQKERNGRSNSMSDFGKSITNIGPNIETIIRRKNEIDKQIEFLSTGKTKAYSGGGVVSLSNNINYFSGGGLSRGTDTVPAMLTPGEFVMSKGAVNKFGTSTMMSMNKAGGGTNKPKVISGTSFASGGGFVNSQPKGPKISDADFATLLAITALEDTDAQGRADVAQSLYNRLYSVNTYGSNYNQSNNTLKSIITAKSEGGRKGGGQYEPTFGNPQDWKNITDMKSAASAVVNSEKGRKYGYTMETAMQQILDTKKAISNPDLQKKAREHVQGRTYFLGKSEQRYMEPGDVLRDPDRNFFSMWYDEDKIYGKERANIASPMPQRLIPPPSPIIPKSSETKVTPQKVGPKGLIESLTDEQGMSGFYMKPINAIFGNRSSNDLSIDKNVRPIIPEPPPSKSMKNGTINLPPIDLGGGGRSPYQEAIPSVQGSQEPKFPAISQMARNIRKKKLDTYGVIL